MKVHVINLERSGERLQRFRATNAHLADVERFAAVDGAAQSTEQLVAQGRLERGLRYTPGAIGAALSHLALWEKCIAQDAPLTACEDDAVLHREFDAASARLLARLPQGWDIVQWAWSFQSAVHFELLHGGGSCLAQCDFREMQQHWAKYQQTAHAFDLYRLRRAFGAICYTVSPSGARKLREAALPLRPMTVWVPDSPNPVANVGIDVVMCAQYDSLAAFLCVPPLALAPQIQDSTIRGAAAAAAQGEHLATKGVS